MQQVIILGTKKHGEKNDPAAMAQALASEVSASVQVIYFEDLVVRINKQERKIYDFLSGVDLADVDLVIALGWYPTGPRNVRDLALAVALYLQERDVELWNAEMAQQRSSTKLSAMWQLASAGVDVPDTVFAMRAEAHLKEAQGYPCVLKDIAGSRGRDNHLVRSAEELEQLLAASNRRYMVQEFIPNDFDLRLVCFGGEAQLVIKRQRTSADTHLNNTSQGGQAEVLPLESLPASVRQEAREICRLFGRQLAGIDYLVANDGSNRYICLEVNAIPQLTSGSFTDEKNKRLSQSVKTALAAMQGKGK